MVFRRFDIDMSRWAGKIAVVTGASAGIGLAIAEAFVKGGMIVVGFARRKAVMEVNFRKMNLSCSLFY